MIIEALAPAVELLVALIQGVVELSVLLLLASVRPWRYALSSKYKAEVDSHLLQRGRLARLWYFSWGSIALAGSIAVVAAAVWVTWQWAAAPPEPVDRAKVIRELGSAVQKKLEAR